MLAIAQSVIADRAASVADPMSGVATNVRRAEGHVLMAVALGRYSEGLTLSCGCRRCGTSVREVGGAFCPADGVGTRRSVAVVRSAKTSGQGEEEPLKLGAVGVGCTVSVERALLEAGRDDLETGPVECPGRRRELRHHVGAVAPLLDHFDHAADLALSPLQPPDHAGHRLAVCFHANSLKAGAGPQ